MSQFAEDIIIPDLLELDIEDLPRGIDNYHIDVTLSSRFCQDLTKLINDLLTHEASAENSGKDNKKVLENLLNQIRDSYQDMMTVLIHRIKTDLRTNEINFIQFAIPKFVLQSVTRALNERINKTKLRSIELRAHGSGEVLKVHHQLAWLSKNYNSILYRINRQIFEQLHRVELRQLKSVREQYLQNSSLNYINFLFNPLLLNRDLNSPLFLIEHYLYWGSSLDQSEFPQLNTQIENLFSEALPELNTQVLKTRETDPPSPTEIYDELGGLHAIRPYLGPTVNSKNHLHENFGWLDNPDNLGKLFDLIKLQKEADVIRQEQGLKAWWETRPHVKRIEAILRDISRIFKQNNLLRMFIASYETRRIWGSHISDQMDPKLLCLYLCGQINLQKLQDPNLGGKTLTVKEEQVVRQSIKKIDDEYKKRENENIVFALKDLSRFRQHLKYFRFAHRLFNRLKILTSNEDIQLSRQAQTLYQLPGSNEIEDQQESIVHHTILKADVRGSTVVTEELEKKNLNPASYFSLHFFDPINKLLSVFGANKVFIEGDAIILSFLEYENNPQQWFGVAHACGIARSMLSIIDRSNQHSKQVGLPMLELGIGICYSDDAPRFLFDGEQPIMISSAIGLADRMSSCSWKLRTKMNPQIFNVEVLEIDKEDRSRGEKGQEYIRYNVNGIMLDNDAFAKLQNEVNLKKISAQIDGSPVVLMGGDYSDMEGNRKFLVIREGRTGLWRNDVIEAGNDDAATYYEVVTNGKIISQVQNALSKK